MKKDRLGKFYKNNHMGISLIVLVITIIVIIILATAVLVSVLSNNPVEEANKARYETDVDAMQTVFTNTVAKVMAQNQGAVNVTAGQINTELNGVSETTGEIVYTVTDAANGANSSGTIYFDKGTNTDTEFYTGKLLPVYTSGETKWYVDGEGNLALEIAGTKYGDGKIPFSQTVLEDVTTYYGKKVTNYTTGNDEIDSQVKWQIFYADEKNIYLITSDYVHYDLLPKAKVTAEDGTVTEYALNKSSAYKAYFNNVLTAYKGSSDITDSRLQALNSDYFAKGYKGEIKNMKAVAYMMDIDIWNTFAGENAEYAIGGPTVEMLMKSYSQKYSASGVDYKAKATSVKGYEISKDGGNNWATYYDGMLDTTDRQYVISSTTRANAMWLASPTAYSANSLMGVYYSGVVGNGSRYISSKQLGFRPLVCLSSNVSLKAVEGGFEIVS